MLVFSTRLPLKAEITHEDCMRPVSYTHLKVLLQMAHSLCEWFMQTYGDWNYQSIPFVMPTDSQKQDIADTDLSLIHI